MTMDENPVIRLQVEALGKQVGAHLMLHGETVRAEVERGIARAIAEADVEALAYAEAKRAVERMVDRAIYEATATVIREHFTDGEGRLAIEKAILRALREREDGR